MALKLPAGFINAFQAIFIMYYTTLLLSSDKLFIPSPDSEDLALFIR